MFTATLERTTQNVVPEMMIQQYDGLVARIARHLMQRLPDTIQLDDLTQSGMIGLLEAAKQFKENQGAQFETYAGIRIRGAMLDEVRRSNWVPRSVYRKSRQVSEAIQRIENREGRDARHTEVAEQLGVGSDEYHQILQDMLNSRTFSLDELGQSVDHFLAECGDSESVPLNDLTRDGFKKALSNAISSIPERERMVISLHYGEGLRLKAIGERLGVSESRVSQINSQAMLRLRARLSAWIDESQIH